MHLTHKSARRAGAALRALAASLLLLGGGAHALECPRGQWLAEYFPNITLSGAPALQRCEKSPIDHYWVGPEGSPNPAHLPVDGFSARVGHRCRDQICQHQPTLIFAAGIGQCRGGDCPATDLGGAVANTGGFRW